MKFMFVFFFLISLIGFLRINLFFNFQSINSQGETIPALVNMSVKITSPSEEKQIPLGELTISGISSDTPNQNCIVFVDWNDLKPFQKVRAAGPGGINDFSEWIFTYDSSYHEIVAGNNELTSKITCLDGSKSLTKWNSINVTGYSQNSSSLPVVHKNTTSLASTSKQLSVQTILPGLNHNTTTIPFEQNTTSFPLSNVSSVEENTTSFPLSNVSSVEENTTSFPLSNVSGSSVEMIIPNESTQNINNSISASPQSTSQLKSKQLTFPNPRIDLDEQRPATTIDDQSNNQTMAPPVIDNQTMAPPVVDNQTMAPPVIDNQTMAPPVVDNQTMAPPVVDNQTMAPPVVDNQTMAPPVIDNQTMAPPVVDNQTMAPPVVDNQTMAPQLPQQPPTLNNQQPPQLPQQPPTLNNQQPPQLPQQPPALENDTSGSTGLPSIEEKSPTEGLFPPFQLPSLFP